MNRLFFIKTHNSTNLFNKYRKLLKIIKNFTEKTLYFLQILVYTIVIDYHIILICIGERGNKNEKKV